MRATVKLKWMQVAKFTWALYHLGTAMVVVQIYTSQYNECTIFLDNQAYSFEFNSEFDQEWRDQLRDIVEENLTSIE